MRKHSTKKEQAPVAEQPEDVRAAGVKATETESASGNGKTKVDSVRGAGTSIITADSPRAVEQVVWGNIEGFARQKVQEFI